VTLPETPGPFPDLLSQQKGAPGNTGIKKTILTTKNTNHTKKTNQPKMQAKKTAKKPFLLLKSGILQ
jgi:hypothetical protein